MSEWATPLKWRNWEAMDLENEHCAFKYGP
jgi:hypothetical protein